MKTLVAFAVAVSTAAVMLALGDTAAKPMAQVIVTAPPEQVFGDLDPLYAAVRRKAETTRTVTGRPPTPVAYSFVRIPNQALGLTAKAGWREIELGVRLMPGPQPGTTALTVTAEPGSLLQSAGTADVLMAVSDVLTRAEPQFVDGGRVKALFYSGSYRAGHPKPYR